MHELKFTALLPSIILWIVLRVITRGQLANGIRVMYSPGGILVSWVMTSASHTTLASDLSALSSLRAWEDEVTAQY